MKMSADTQVKPFLRWAGGKSRLVTKLLHYVPSSDMYGKYIEPFLGSGALFFKLKPDSALLADMNSHLINCYRQIARKPKEVWEKLQEHKNKDSKEYYNSIRDTGLDSGTVVDRAAFFLYLNKTAFNGIFRVNKSGKFNVPYGTVRSSSSWISLEELRGVSKYLQVAEFYVGSFEDACKQANKGDFVYLDPPYPPLTKSAYFTQYTAGGFSLEDQKRVAETFKWLDKKGCLVMMSNSDQKSIRDLYDGFYMDTLKVTRLIGSNGDRFKVDELVVTNYPIVNQQLKLI